MKNNFLGDQFDRTVREPKKSRSSQGGSPNRRVRLFLDHLEERQVPAVVSVLPPALVSNAGPIDPTSAATAYSPQVAISPVNPQWIVEVHSTTAGVAGYYTNDAGVTWNAIAFPTQPNIDPNANNSNVFDPNIYQGTAPFKTPFAVTENTGLAFDKDGNFYVLSSQHDATNANGAIVFQKFSMAGGTPTSVGDAQRLYSWRNQDQAYHPVIAIDTNQATYTDPQSGAVTTDSLADKSFLLNTKTTAALLATDTTVNVVSAANLPAVPFLVQVDDEQMKVTAVNGTALTVVRGYNGTTAATHLITTTVATLSTVPKGIFVAWNVNSTQTPNIGLPTTVSRIVTMVSPDGGTSFTTQQLVSPAGVAIDASSPRIVFSQAGGELNYFYDYKFIIPPPPPTPPNGINIDKSTPDNGVTNAAVAATQTFTSVNAGPIQDATTSNNPTSTISNTDIAAGGQVVYVPINNNSTQFATGDRFKITTGAGANAATEEFRITNVLTGSTLLFAAPGTLATPPALDTISVVSNLAFRVGDAIQVDNEIMSITAIAGSTLTVTRAQGGTVLAAHTAGTVVTNLSEIRWNIVGGQNMTTPAFHAAGSVLQKLAATASIPSISTFTQTVTIDAASLTTIKDLDVKLDIVHPNLEHLKIELVPPVGSGLQPIVLVQNRLDADAAVRGNPPFGITGKNLGAIELGSSPFIEYNSVGTVFSQSADRSINVSNAAAPYIGYFKPETGSLDVVNGLAYTKLNGTWTLRITDFVNDTTSAPFPVQFVKDWSLNFTGVIDTQGFGQDADTGITITLPPPGVTPAVLPSVTNSYPLINAATGPAGIGHGVSMAVDNTLGGFSPYQGRMYLAYNGNGGTNTNVYLITSDDNGQTWSSAVQINDDSIADNYTEGNRPQFTPTVTVDPVTGTVVVSYYDARNDAALARVSEAIVTSVDGGKTFSKVSYANPVHTNIDFLTGKTIVVETIPGNQALASAFGFGDHQGIVSYGGNIIPVYASNANAGGSTIYTAKVTTSAGPRVVFGDSGTVTNTFTSDLLTGVVSYNNTFAADGTRQLDGFLVQFDRPVDVSSFTASDVVVQFKDAVTGATSIIPLNAATGVTPLDMPQVVNFAFGPKQVGIGTLATQFFIRLATPQSKPGTYSYFIGDAVYDSIRSATSAVVPVVPPAGFAAPFTSAAAVPIADLATTISTIAVPALPVGQVLAGVTVTVNLAHTNDSDLDLYLVSPLGTRVLLSNQNGGTGANYTGTIFDDAAATSIVSGLAPFTGSFRPEGALAQLQGQNPFGNWTLEVQDKVAGNTGTINSWSMTMTVGTNVNGNEMDQNANGLAGEAIAYVPGGNASTLTGAVATTDTSITLASAVGFPAAPFVVQIGAEQMLVTGVAGSTFTVLRGYNGTLVDTHAANDAVTEYVLLNASTTLDSDALASDTTIIATVPNGFPAAPFVIQIGTEQMRVTGTDAFGNWQVIRGFNGTDAIDHTAGDVIVSVNAPDVYSNPSPLGSAGATITGVPFSSPFNSQTLPLIIPGLHVERTSAPDSSGNYVANSIVTTSLSQLGIAGGIYAMADDDLSFTSGTLLDPNGLGMTAAPNNTQQVITVSATTPPGLVMPFVATIQNERVQVVNMVGNQWTVIRGIGGTAAVAHAAGTRVTYALAMTNSAATAVAVTAATTTFTMASTLAPGAAVPFYAQFGTETVRVTAINGNQWTVARAQIGSVAAAQPAGTVLTFNTPLAAQLPLLVRVDNEIMRITQVFGTNTYIVDRGLENTIPTAHLDDATLSDVGGIDATATKIRVASSVGFPTTATTNPFTIQIDGEMLSVIAVDTATNIWTVIRGINGTTIPDEHKNGATITYVPTTNVAVNTSSSFVDITFERAVNPSTFTAADVLSVTGPMGAITGTFTVTPNPAGTPASMTNRVFRVGFPTQTLSGSYNVVLAPTINDTLGNQVDQNLNAGLDLLRGTADPTTTTLDRPSYSVSPNLTIGANKTVSVQLSINDVFNIVQSTTQLSFSGPIGTSINQTGGLISATPNQTTLTVLSNLGFPNALQTPFVVQIDAEQIQVLDNSTTTWTIVRGFNGTTVAAHANGTQIKLGQPNTIEALLNVTFPDVRTLSATLTSPDGKVINLFLTGTTGKFGTHANLNDTVFDDSATTPIQNASSPISAGPFNPQFPLSVLNGSSSAGKWTLTIRNSGPSTGTINRFELRLPRVVPSNGIGEPVGDRITASFRIFTFASTNPQSADQWTPVGPVGNTKDPAVNGDNGGPVDSVTLDPSDPTGNTAYAGAATGGIWKTTNFLTKDPSGPNWIPLTDFGPGNSLNIGSIAVLPRNNDPGQTIIIAATGNSGYTFQTGSPANNQINLTGGPGVGFLRSMDGGRTWQVLDSTVNVDTSGNILTMGSAGRDHKFVGTIGSKVLIDPTPLPNGNIAVYAALGNPTGTGNGGIYRSLDGGNNWTLIRAGDATDVILGAASRNNNGNLTQLYGAFYQEGVFRGLGDAPSTGGMTILNGGVNPATPRLALVPGTPQIPTANNQSPNSAASGTIVLATPSLSNTPLADTFYQGWVYAGVADVFGALDALYVTKDFGFTWTRVTLPSAPSGTGPSGFGTNNDARSAAFNVDPLTGTQSRGNYALAITVDPNNPNIVYLGGATGMLRIDITKLDDPYTLDPFINDDADGGKAQTATTGATSIGTLTQPWGIVAYPDVTDPNNSVILSNYYNLYRDPLNPFVAPSSLGFTNVTQFNNSGTEVTWMPFGLTGSSNYHQIVAMKDPVSGATRLIFANDSGIQYGVDDGTGNYITNIGNTPLGTGYRNGNMQTAQIVAGSSQPSALAAALAGAIFYGNSTTIDGLQANPNIISTGDLRWAGTSSSGSIVSDTEVVLGRVTGVAGVGADQTGSGTYYRFVYPSNLSSPFLPTDFFQFTPAGQLAISRVSGLVQGGDNPNTAVNQGQWGAYQGSNFAVNPIDTTGLIIASQQGRIFRSAGPTTGSGVQWFQTATTGETGPAPALAFGSLNSVANTRNDFFYVGYESGKAFVTFNGGSTWVNLSNGLDGSAVAQIVTNPIPGSKEAYAVTQNAVYWMKDSSVTGASWVKISDNLGLVTTINAPLSATGTTMSVSSRVGFPTTPFVVQLGTGEQVLVTTATTTTWTIQRGYNNTTAVAAGATTQVQLYNPLFGLTSKIFNVNGDTAQTLKFLTSIQADWRYAVPDAVVTTTLSTGMNNTQTTMTVASSVGLPPTPFIVTIGSEQIQVNSLISGTTYAVTRGVNATTATAKSANAIVTPTGGTHPVLYVAGAGGVFRSRDKGQTWELFPSFKTDGAVVDGGLMPNVQVTALNLALGNINSQTGFADTSSGYNMLLASTFGRGDFAIRLDNSPIAQYIAVPNHGPQVANFNPTVQANGSQFTGFTITFGGAVDPTSFTAADITVTGPGGAISLAAANAVVDLIGSDPHNKYQITFATPQTSVGDYIIKVGPDVLDYSGNKMDQNNNNINGETADAYTNTFKFTSNTPPTISTIANQAVTPGSSTSPIPFTIGDAETAAASLSLTPAPFVTTLPGYTGAAPTIFVGGTGAARTITVTAPAGAHGQATVTITVQDADGLQTATTFTVSVDTAPVIPAINPLTINHGTAPAPINLNATDPDGDQVDFTVSFTDPLFAVKTTYGLTATSELKQYFNNSGQGERYLVASNGTNYLLLPDGNLYLRSTNAVVANVGIAAYNNPDLLLTTTGTPLVSLPNPLYDLKTKYGLLTPAGYFNAGSFNEYYLSSSNGSGEFVLTSSNTLITRYTRTLVADFTALGYGNVYADPSLLTSASLLTAPAITATTVSKPAGAGAGGSVTLIPNPAFVGTVGVTVTGTGLALSTSQSFNFTVNEVAPTITNPGTQSTTHNTPLNLSLPITDSDPDAGSRTFTVDFSNPLYDVQSQYGLTKAFGNADASRGGAKFTLSSNGSNAAGAYYFYLLPDNKLYLNGSNTMVQDFAGLGDVYNNPYLLTTASPVPATAFLNHGPLFDLKMEYQLNAYPGGYNQGGRAELYFAAGTGGYVVLVPNAGFTDATLAPWDGVSITSSLASPKAKNIGIEAYFNPQLLYNAEPVFVGDSLYALRQKYGFFYPEAYFNAGGQQEKYLYAKTSGSYNYFIKPDGFLYRVTTGNGVGVQVANVGVNVYNNPALLYNSTGQAQAVTTTGSGIVGNNLNLVLTPNAAFTGALKVKVTISDGAMTSTQGFLLTVTDSTQPTAPTPIASPVLATSASGGTAVSLAPPTFADTDGDTLAYSVVVTDPLVKLQTLYGLTNAATAIIPSRDNARFLLSSNSSNYYGGGGYFLIKPVAGKYQLLASDGSTSGGAVVYDDVGLAVYNNPALLTSATTPAALAGVTTNIAANMLTIAWPTSYAGTFAVDVFANDGAASTKQSFLVKVS